METSSRTRTTQTRYIFEFLKFKNIQIQAQLADVFVISFPHFTFTLTAKSLRCLLDVVLTACFRAYLNAGEAVS